MFRISAILILAACASPEGNEWSVYDNRWWSGEAGEQIEGGVKAGFPNINTVPKPPPAGTYGVLLTELRGGYKGRAEESEGQDDE